MRIQRTDRARKRKMENLVRHSTFKLVVEKDLPSVPNIISGSSVIAIKDVKRAKPIFKTRFLFTEIVMLRNANLFTIQRISDIVMQEYW